MENYSKGKNVEEEWEKEKLGIPNLPNNFTWMHVKGGSKMSNLLEYALNDFKETGAVLWSGSGPAVCKTISCAEIMKKRCKGIKQINKICYRKVEEYWTPQLDGLDELVVTRELPSIHIFLSRESLDEKDPGFQDPNARNRFWSPASDYKKREEFKKKYKPKIDAKTFEEVGLRSSNFNKRTKNLYASADKDE